MTDLTFYIAGEDGDPNAVDPLISSLDVTAYEITMDTTLTAGTIDASILVKDEYDQYAFLNFDINVYECFTGCETCSDDWYNTCTSCKANYYMTQTTYECVDVCPLG